MYNVYVYIINEDVSVSIMHYEMNIFKNIIINQECDSFINED